MAKQNSTSTLKRVDLGAHATRTPNWHYAAMRRYEDAARSISGRRSAGSIPAGELEAAKTVQTSYYLMAAAYRSAGRRRERAERRAADWKLFRQQPARYFRLVGRDMAATVRIASRRIVKAVAA